MKMIERIRRVRQRSEANEFVRLWTKFEETGTGPAGDVTRMISLGRLLADAIADASQDHLRDQVRSQSLNEAHLELVVLEVERARDRAVAKVFPEFTAFREFLERTVRGPREQGVVSA